MNNQNICRAGDCRKTVFSTPCAASNFSTINMANNTTTKPVFETACADMDEDEVRLLMAECAADGCIRSVAITEDRKYVTLRRKTFPPKPMPSDIPLDGLEQEYLETHPPYPKLIKKFPHLKGLPVSKWYSAIPHDFAADNPRLMQTLFNLSEETQTEIKDTLLLCPSMRKEMHHELDAQTELAHAAEVGGLPQIVGLPPAAFEDTTAQGGERESYRKYPQDAEALALLAAAKKKLEALQKKRPNATQAEAVKAVLEEPWVTETKKQKEQRQNFQDRVWQGARGKNDVRKKATVTRPERLDATTRAAKWERHYRDWGKHLSCYLKHPPAK